MVITVSGNASQPPFGRLGNTFCDVHQRIVHADSPLSSICYSGYLASKRARERPLLGESGMAAMQWSTWEADTVARVLKGGQFQSMKAVSFFGPVTLLLLSSCSRSEPGPSSPAICRESPPDDYRDYDAWIARARKAGCQIVDSDEEALSIRNRAIASRATIAP